MARFQKKTTAHLDYGFRWQRWLKGDTIASSTWSGPVGVVLDNMSFTATTTTAWVSGGTFGQEYEIVNQIITTNGRTDSRSHIIVII